MNIILPIIVYLMCRHTRLRDILTCTCFAVFHLARSPWYRSQSPARDLSNADIIMSHFFYVCVLTPSAFLKNEAEPCVKPLVPFKDCLFVPPLAVLSFATWILQIISLKREKSQKFHQFTLLLVINLVAEEIESKNNLALAFLVFLFPQIVQILIQKYLTRALHER